MTDCKECELSKSRPNHGGYDFRCATCCARLIKSARPLRGQQDALMYAITRNAWAPEKHQIINKIKELDEA